MTDAPTPATGSDRELVTLETPIARAGGDIGAVAVRRPMPVDLQGLSLRDIVDMEASAMMVLLPRITDPALLAGEVATMKSPRDFLALSAEASGFFLPKAVRPVSQPQ